MINANTHIANNADQKKELFAMSKLISKGNARITLKT
jgi:hypothetical protein